MVRSSIPGYIDDTTKLNTALSCRLVDGDLRSLAPVSPDSVIVRRSHIHNSKYESRQAAATNKFTRFPRSAPISRARSGDSVPDSDAQRSRSRPRFRPQLSFGVD